MSKSKDQPVKFEQAIQKLETLIERIESGQIGLEESLSAYEQGVKLIAHCRSVLAAAEKKIAELSVDDKGRLTEEVAAEHDEEEAQNDE